MSNVILGTIAVVLFIGLAVAGASYFGSAVGRSNSQSQALLVAQQLSAVAQAVALKSQERGEVIRAGGSLADLAPDYMQETPQNPLGGAAPILLDAAGTQSGEAVTVVLEIPGSSAGTICDELSRMGRGPATAPSARTGDPARPMGCFVINAAEGSFQMGDRIAYAALN